MIAKDGCYLNVEVKVFGLMDGLVGLTVRSGSGNLKSVALMA
jgi:hypothetical protein